MTRRAVVDRFAIILELDQLLFQLEVPRYAEIFQAFLNGEDVDMDKKYSEYLPQRMLNGTSLITKNLPKKVRERAVKRMFPNL